MVKWRGMGSVGLPVNPSVNCRRNATSNESYDGYASRSDAETATSMEGLFDKPCAAVSVHRSTGTLPSRYSAMPWLMLTAIIPRVSFGADMSLCRFLPIA
jgi:hypothetical protein